MTELIFIVCLSATPDVCERQTLSYLDISPRTCVMAAQPQLARWVNEHPGWEVSRWSCRLSGVSHDA